MEWRGFLVAFGHLPVIETEILLAGVSAPGANKVQVSRWRKQGNLIRLRRGIYVLAPAFRKSEPNEFHVASLLNRPSYVSLEKGLEFHGIIPEGVPVYTSVTAKRPERLNTPLGVFDYRHVKSSLFWGYETLTLNGQTAHIASPEKALLDYFYLRGSDASPERLDELRLQNLKKVDARKLAAFAKRFAVPGIERAARALQLLLRTHVKVEKRP